MSSLMTATYLQKDQNVLFKSGFDVTVALGFHSAVNQHIRMLPLKTENRSVGYIRVH